MANERIHRDSYVAPPALILLLLFFALRHVFCLMPIIRQMLGSWTEAESSVWFLPGDFVAIVLLYTWLNRIPTAGRGFRTIWRYGRELLTFAYLWSAACLVWLNKAVLVNPDHRHFVAIVVLLALDGLVITYLLRSSQVKAVFASFPPPDQADKLKLLATESANAKRQLMAAAKLAAPIAADATPESVRENELRTLVDVEPTHAMAWFELGVLAYQHQKTDQAQAFMNKALACDAQNAFILRSLCELSRQKGRLVDAVRYGREAVALAPDDEITQLNLALALTDYKDPESALTHYHRVLDINPHNVQAWLNMAVLLAQQNRREDALAALDAVLIIEPEHLYAQMLKRRMTGQSAE